MNRNELTDILSIFYGGDSKLDEQRKENIKIGHNKIDLNYILNELTEEDPMIEPHTFKESFYQHSYRGRCKYDELLGFYKRNLGKLNKGESPESRALLECHKEHRYNFYGRGKGLFEEIDGSPKMFLDDRYAKRDIDSLKHHYKRRVVNQTKNANTLRVCKALQAYKDKHRVIVDEKQKKKVVVVTPEGV